MRGLDRLLDLQEIDLAIGRLEARKRVLGSGEEIAAARAEVERLEERLGEERLALGSVAEEQSRLEGEAEAIRAKIEAEERRLFDGSVANPRELESIQSEVAALKQRLGRVEDAVIEQMERREALERQVGELEPQVMAARRRLEELVSSAEEEAREVERQLAERRAERERVAAEVDEELLQLYEDLRAQKKGVGAVALVDGVCQGCHQQLSPLGLDRLKRTEGVRRCEYCRRILVVP